jgi:hypothetical protein
LDAVLALENDNDDGNSAVLGAVAALSAPAVITNLPHNAPAAPFVRVADTGGCEVTEKKYLALRNGMSYREAVGVLGCEGTEIHSSMFRNIKTEMFMWRGAGIVVNMNATFRNGALLSSYARLHRANQRAGWPE